MFFATINHPCYRKTNLCSINGEGIALLINEIPYPENLMIGNPSDSSKNKEFLNELNKCSSLTNSNINRYNYAITCPTVTIIF